jgi:pSer/pThr/pTyr-binding forkhead associated (FHA) protein
MSRRLIVSGGSRPRELVLVDTLIVGRDPACDISEHNDPLMSRRHAAFTADAKHAMVRDLGSRNGILVNGTKIPEAQLRHGDVVQIGHLQVKFVDEVGPFRDAPSPAGDAATVIVDSAKTVRFDNGNDVTRKL